MKKALLLGALAFFAINIATVQNVNAQNKETKKTADETKIEKEKAAAQAETLKADNKGATTKKVSTAETAKENKATPKMDKKAAKKATKAASSKEAKLSSKPATTKSAPAAMKPKKPTDPKMTTTSGNKKTVK